MRHLRTELSRIELCQVLTSALQIFDGIHVDMDPRIVNWHVRH